MGNFPSSKTDALTMLYLKNQDLSGLTPEQLLDKYQDVHDRIYNYEHAKLEEDASNFNFE